MWGILLIWTKLGRAWIQNLLTYYLKHYKWAACYKFAMAPQMNYSKDKLYLQKKKKSNWHQWQQITLQKTHRKNTKCGANFVTLHEVRSGIWKWNTTLITHSLYTSNFNIFWNRIVFHYHHCVYKYDDYSNRLQRKRCFSVTNILLRVIEKLSQNF